MKKHIGEFIQLAIEMNDLTQKETADALNLAPQTLNSYIHNKRSPDIETFAQIMRYLKMDSNIILGIKPNPNFSTIMDAEEIRLLRNFRKLDDEHKEFASFLLENMPK